MLEFMDEGKRSEPVELIAVLVFGFLLKLFAGRNSLTEHGIVFPGYDEYYHMRRILYGTSNFPDTLWFDTYLNYPHGFSITWPPLFDQISAALCIALGQHTKEGVEMTAAFVPVIIGLLAMVVVYYIMRELFDHRIALLASFMTALAPYYLLYTMVAATDHHSLEVLFQLLSLLFMVLAFSRPDKRWLYASAAGVALAALAYTWQGADVYFGAYLLFATVGISLELRQEKPNLNIVSTLLVAFFLALILVLPFRNTPWMSPSFLGLAAIFVALAIMLALAHIIAKRSISWKAFPLAILAIFIISLLLSKILGGFFGLEGLIRTGMGYIWGGEMIGKIGEAEPLIYDLDTLSQVVFSWLGLNILFSLAGAAAIVVYMRKEERRMQQSLLLLLIWAVFSILLTLGQGRFLYISTIFMGMLISILIFYALDRLKKFQEERGAKLNRALAAAVILLLVLPTAIDAFNFANNSPPAIAGDWQDSLFWLKENSDPTSHFADPEEIPEYSVMSWWDYGNWILYLSERPVVANNFQTGIEDAVKFYLAEDEKEATEIMDARGARYVFADFGIAYGKLPSLTEWADEDISSYMALEEYGAQLSAKPKERFFNTTLGKLYLADGTGMGRFRLIHESSTIMGNVGKSRVMIFQYVPGALLKIHTGRDGNGMALLNMTSNMDRRFVYLNQATWNGDALEVRVPYSTEREHEVHATDPYMVFSVHGDDVKAKTVEVSEEDVLQGRTIDINF